jgi:hypothetical protein
MKLSLSIFVEAPKQTLIVRFKEFYAWKGLTEPEIDELLAARMNEEWLEVAAQKYLPTSPLRRRIRPQLFKKGRLHDYFFGSLQNQFRRRRLGHLVFYKKARRGSLNTINKYIYISIHPYFNRTKTC